MTKSEAQGRATGSDPMSSGARNRIARVIVGPIERVLVNSAQSLYRRWLRLKYSQLPQGHVFVVIIDDFEYELSFGDHPIGNAIVQRIQGRREPETMAVYRSLIRPGDNILEMGACYGEFSILLAHCTGDDGKVVAIEGTPNNFTLLEKNLRRNDVRNVDAYDLFVSSTSDEVRFGADDTHPYHAIAALKNQDGLEDDSYHVSVKTVRITDFLKTIEFTPDLVFMDIEGFEMDVFDDFFGTEFFRWCRPTIMFETHPQFYEGDRDLAHIVNGLAQVGYGMRRIAGNALCFPVDTKSDRSSGENG